MLRASRGQVVFVNSGAGLKVLDGMASYSASKFALRAFAESLREEDERNEPEKVRHRGFVEEGRHGRRR